MRETDTTSQRNAPVDPYTTSPVSARRPRTDAFAEGVQHTQYAVCILVKGQSSDEVSIRQPIVTGTSVLAIKFKDGILMAADTLGTFTTPNSYNPYLNTCSQLPTALLRGTRRSSVYIPSAPQQWSVQGAI